MMSPSSLPRSSPSHPGTQCPLALPLLTVELIGTWLWKFPPEAILNWTAQFPPTSDRASPLTGPEEVSIINVLMWVSAEHTARGGWCAATRLDWNKLTTSYVYIMDDNGKRRGNLSCSFISACCIVSVPFDRSVRSEGIEVATVEVNLYPPGRQHICHCLRIDFGPGSANASIHFTDLMKRLWRNWGMRPTANLNMTVHTKTH